MSSDGSTVLFQAVPPGQKFSTEEKRTLKGFVQLLSNRVVEGRSFVCLLTNDRQLRRLNRDFLGHDYATDVLSFQAADSHSLGELAISVERAAIQAVEFGHDRLEEIRILMLHGVLHLAGMDHEQDGGQMARAERKWRDAFGLPTTLITRSRSRRQPEIHLEAGL